MREECIDGYMVVQNGEVLFERYYDNFGRSRPSYLVLHDQIADLNRFRHCASRVPDIDEGKTPADFMPELADSVFATVSVRDVLNMVTALNYTEE